MRTWVYFYTTKYSQLTTIKLHNRETSSSMATQSEYNCMISKFLVTNISIEIQSYELN